MNRGSHDLTASSFVVGALVAQGATMSSVNPIIDPVDCTFDVPGMGRIRVRVEAVDLSEHEATKEDNGGD